MSKKKLLYVICCLLFVLAMVWIWTKDFVDISKENVNFEITLFSDINDDYQLFYSPEEKVTKNSFDANNSYIATLMKTNENDWFSFVVPADTRYVRFDSGNSTPEYEIKSVIIRHGEDTTKLDISDMDNICLKNDIAKVEYDADKGLVVTAAGADSYIVWDLADANIDKMVNKDKLGLIVGIRIGLSIVVLLIALLLYRVREKIIGELRDVYTSRKIIRDLSKNDFKNKFSGSYMGVFWAFVQPVVIVIIYWFVFSVGFKSAPVADVPYLLWLVSGICPWFFFNDALNAGTNSLYEYSYIVKKVAFKISVLPIIKIISCAFVHLFFIALVAVVFLLHGVVPSIYVLQVLYYSFCTFVLALGLAYLTASLSVFVKDLAQIVNILLQFGMWMTPIMYSEDMFGPKVAKILKLNPIYYLVDGYRDSFIGEVGFWEHDILTIYFWGVTLVIFVVGALVFRKLKPHFADVL